MYVTYSSVHINNSIKSDFSKKVFREYTVPFRCNNNISVVLLYTV